MSGNYGSAVDTYEKHDEIVRKFMARSTLSEANRSIQKTQVHENYNNILKKLSGRTKDRYKNWYKQEIDGKWDSPNVTTDSRDLNIFKQLFLAKIGYLSNGKVDSLESENAALRSQKASLETDKKELQVDLQKVTLECQREKNNISLANKNASIARLQADNAKAKEAAKVPLWKRILNLMGV